MSCNNTGENTDGLENFDLDQIYTVMTLKLISVNLIENKICDLIN